MFPKLTGVASPTEGEGLTVEVRFVKKDGLPVTHTADTETDAAAVRTVDLQKKFYMGAYDLADRAGVPRGKATALRRHLGLDTNDDHFSHRFVFGNSRHLRYSDNSPRAMKEALTEVDLAKVHSSHRTLPYNKLGQTLPLCNQPGCVASQS